MPRRLFFQLKSTPQIADLSYNFGRVLRELAKELEDLTGAMMVRAYDFRLDGEDRGHQRSDFRTGVSSNDYPVALINNWFLDLDCDIRYAPWNPELLVNWKSGTPPREWLVSARDAGQGLRLSLFQSGRHVHQGVHHRIWQQTWTQWSDEGWHPAVAVTCVEGGSWCLVGRVDSCVVPVSR